MTQFTIPTVYTAVDKFTSPVTKMMTTNKAFASSCTSLSSKSASAFALVDRGLRNTTNTLDGFTGKIFNLKNAFIVAGAAMLARKLFDITESVSVAGDKIAKDAKRLGLLPEALQQLQFAADMSGINPDEFTSGMEAMNISVGKLQSGSGKLYSYLAKSNPVLLTQMKRVKTNEEAFGLLSGAISKMPNDFKKANLAALAFGGAGSKMLNLISEGPENIMKLRMEASKLGIISNAAAAQSEEFNDMQTRMNAAVHGTYLVLGSELMPVIQKLMIKFTDWIVQHKDLIKVKVVTFINKISTGIEWLSTNSEKVVSTLKLFGGTLLALKAISLAASLATNLITLSTVGYNVAVKAVTAAQWLWNAATTAGAMAMAILTAPITLIIIGIAALGAFVYSLIKHWNDWGAAVSLILGPLGLVISLIQSFRRNWDMISEAFKTGGILEGIKAIGKTILDAVLMPIQQVLELVAKFTGADWASNAVKKIEGFRAEIGVAESVNPKLAEQESMRTIVRENTNNNRMDWTVTDPLGLLKPKSKDSLISMPRVGSTLMGSF